MKTLIHAKCWVTPPNFLGKAVENTEMLKRLTIVGSSAAIFDFALTDMAVGAKLLKKNRTGPLPVPYQDTLSLFEDRKKNGQRKWNQTFDVGRLHFHLDGLVIGKRYTISADRYDWRNELRVVESRSAGTTVIPLTTDNISPE